LQFSVEVSCIIIVIKTKLLTLFSILGFIEFIVEPSMAVCSDMLEAILGPIHSSCKPSDSTQQSISEDSELDRKKNGNVLVLYSQFCGNTV
jgi:hypothetical protein